MKLSEKINNVRENLQNYLDEKFDLSFGAKTLLGGSVVSTVAALPIAVNVIPHLISHQPTAIATTAGAAAAVTGLALTQIAIALDPERAAKDGARLGAMAASPFVAAKHALNSVFGDHASVSQVLENNPPQLPNTHSPVAPRLEP